MNKTKLLDEKCAICNHKRGVHNQASGCDDCWKEYIKDCEKKGIPIYFGLPERHDFKSKEEGKE